MAWLTDITAFRLFDMTERLWFNALFLAKQIGEFDWTWFYVQSSIRFEIIHWCLIRWTPHLCKWSKHWIFPPNTGLSPQNWGRKGVGNEGWRVKLKFYTHNFVSFPPTHHMLEGKCHTKQISLIFSWMHNTWEMQHALRVTRVERSFTKHVWPMVHLRHVFFEETLFHHCPLYYKQISASWHKAYSHTWISSK